MNVIGAPMIGVNTGWVGLNAWITGCIWGPGDSIFASEQTSFRWAPYPVTYPYYYEHTLYNQRQVTRYGIAFCSTYFTGSIVNGPVYGTCQNTPR